MSDETRDFSGYSEIQLLENAERLRETARRAREFLANGQFSFIKEAFLGNSQLLGIACGTEYVLTRAAKDVEELAEAFGHALDERREARREARDMAMTEKGREDAIRSTAAALDSIVKDSKR